MCRWISYIGKPVYLDTFITRPQHSLVMQSLEARESFRPDGSILSTNGDGFGFGWYMDKPEPGLFRTAEPAWANENINELCSQIRGKIIMAHIRAASTGSIQRTNAHPFKYKNWLFQHNGYLGSFDLLRRELLFAITPEYFSYLKGTTDSEVLFLLALSMGMEENPKRAWEDVIRFIRSLCEQKQIAFDAIISAAVSDGKALYTFRYSSTSRAHSQYYATHAECMKEMNADSEDLPNYSVVVVSEPLDQSLENWVEMPVGSFATFHSGSILKDNKAHIEPLNI